MTLIYILYHVVDYLKAFTKHFDDLLTAITYPLGLAQSLRKDELVPQQLVDSILQNNESQDVKVNKLLREVKVLFKVSRPEQLRTKIMAFCKILSDHSPALSVVADEILKECRII